MHWVVDAPMRREGRSAFAQPENDLIIMDIMLPQMTANLTIVDKGLGSPKSELTRVFDRFYRLIVSFARVLRLRPGPKPCEMGCWD